jgi:hypothetical protein
VRIRAPRLLPPETARFEWPPMRLWLWAAGVMAAIAGIAAVLYLQRPRVSGWRSEVVTVVSHVGGRVGKRAGVFDHRVRFPDGTLATIALGELVGRDERLRVDYARAKDGGIVFRTPIRCGDRPDC